MLKESYIQTPKPALIESGYAGSLKPETVYGGAIGWTWSSNGVETPNFRKTQARALLPANPYNTLKLECTECFQTGSAVGSGNFIWQMRPGSGLEPRYSTRVDRAYLSILRGRHDLDFDKALHAAVSSLATRYFDLGTFLAELKSTIKLFSGLVQRFLKLLTSHDPRKLGDAWLELRYGWRPLYYDMQAFAKALTDVKSPPYRLFKERKGDESVITDETSRRVGNVRVTTRVISRLSIRGTAETLIEPTRFRLAPLTTAWELVPFSFIVDWFLTVGNALASLEASIEFPDLQTSAGYYHTFSVSTEIDDFVAAGWTGTFHGRETFIGYEKARFPLSSSFVPSFQFELDAFKLVDLVLIALKLKGR